MNLVLPHCRWILYRLSHLEWYNTQRIESGLSRLPKRMAAMRSLSASYLASTFIILFSPHTSVAIYLYFRVEKIEASKYNKYVVQCHTAVEWESRSGSSG